MDKKVVKLTNGDVIFGELHKVDDQNVIIKEPYTVENMQPMPYMFTTFMEPMKQVKLRVFDIMWACDLSEFSQLETIYLEATTGIKTEATQKIIV